MIARILKRLAAILYRRAHAIERRNAPRALTHVGGVPRITLEQ
jgi:hypothetical protein